jgi:hypothetical protein
MHRHAIIRAFAIVAGLFGAFSSMPADIVYASQAADDAEAFEFPTSATEASFHFVRSPDLFNWNIGYPQPGCEEAMDWSLGMLVIESCPGVNETLVTTGLFEAAVL